MQNLRWVNLLGRIISGCDLLVQQGLHKALGKKPTYNTNKECEEINLRIVCIICKRLANKMLYNVINKSSTPKL